MLFEVSEELGVSEMLETGGVVGHDIGVSWEVERDVAVAFLALVSTSVVAQSGTSSIAGDGSLCCA